MSTQDRNLLTVGEVAEALRCHVDTVRRQIASRRIAAVRVGGRWLIGRDQLDVIRALAGATVMRAEQTPTMAIACNTRNEP